MPFFKHEKSYSIQRFRELKTNDHKKFLLDRIKFLDSQITDTSKAIFQAQSVRVRSLFSQENGFFGGLQKKLVESSVENSINWHQSQLIELTKERNKLQHQLDKLTGQVWPKRLRKYFTYFIFWGVLLLTGGLEPCNNCVSFSISIIIVSNLEL